MKPCSGDIRHKILIRGGELPKLKRHTGSIAEAFGLDGKIDPLRDDPAFRSTSS